MEPFDPTRPFTLYSTVFAHPPDHPPHCPPLAFHSGVLSKMVPYCNGRPVQLYLRRLSLPICSFLLPHFFYLCFRLLYHSIFLFSFFCCCRFRLSILNDQRYLISLFIFLFNLRLLSYLYLIPFLSLYCFRFGYFFRLGLH